MRQFFVTATILGTVIVLSGCGKSSSTGVDGSSYLLTAEPSGALGVAAAKLDKTDEVVTVVGRIGGSEKPFVEGIAAFTIVDPQIAPCGVDEGCPTPWDYCCAQDKMKDNLATVKVVDSKGSPITADAKQLLKIKELSTVVVQGKPQRDPEGNLTILASKVYVKE
jgi:hypothetical protein